MATHAQIMANRRNSLLSTGPRTNAGKEASGQNSTTHGLTGQHIVRSRCSHDKAFAAYYDSMLPELAPASALELDFAQRIIHDSWRLNRAGAMSENLLFNGRAENLSGPRGFNDDDADVLAEARAFRANANTFNLLSLYEQRLQRAILKNLAALKAMQKERKAQPKSAPKQVLQPIEVPAPSAGIGFVCSTPEPDPAPPPPAVENAPEIMAA